MTRRKTIIENLHLHVSASFSPEEIRAALDAVLHSQNTHVETIHNGSSSVSLGKNEQKPQANLNRVSKTKNSKPGTGTGARKRRNMRARFQRAAKAFPGESVCIATALPHDINEAEIKEFFTKTAGPVSTVKIECEPNTTASRGIAVITFQDANVAAAAVRDINGVLVDGKRIRVLAVPKDCAVPEDCAAVPAVPKDCGSAEMQDPKEGRLGFGDEEMLERVPNVDLERGEMEVQGEGLVQAEVQVEGPGNKEVQGQGTNEVDLMEMKEGEVQVQVPENDKMQMQNQGASEGTEQVNLMGIGEGETQDVNVNVNVEVQGAEVMDLDVAEDMMLGHLGLMSRSDETRRR